MKLVLQLHFKRRNPFGAKESCAGCNKSIFLLARIKNKQYATIGPDGKTYSGVTELKDGLRAFRYCKTLDQYVENMSKAEVCHYFAAGKVFKKLF